jgi:hypothetical protein
MAKSRSNRKSLIKRITKKTLPVVNKGLKTIGNTAKNVAEKSIPIIEKGVSTVYGTMATGFDLGVKGANTVAKGITNKKHTKRHRVRKTRRRRNH